MLNRIILFLFFLSGGSSLILEVIWVKLFSLVFGNTVFAVSAVLSSFFFGLALGSYLLGHFSDRYRGKFLLLYGLIEITIAIYALILPKLIPLVHFFYFPMIQSQSLGFHELSLLRFAIAFLLLVVPTTLMGASLPVLTRYIVSEHDRLATSLGRLYAFNTLGAMAGCMTAGFLLIAALGVSGANLVAVCISGAVGITAIYLSRSERERAPVEHAPAEAGASAADRFSMFLLAAYGICGFSAIAYEVVWVRILATVLGPTTYSFSIMLTIFLAGIALGSLAASRLADRVKSLLYIFGLMEVVIGLMAIWMLPLFKMMFAWFAGLRGTDMSWHSLITLEVLVCFAILFPPTFIMGAAFPVVGKLYVRAISRLGGATGRLYAFNTLGGIFGSAVTGFALLPWLGVKGSTLLVAGLNIAVGLVLILADRPGARKYVTTACGCLAFAGALVYFNSFNMISGLNLLFYREDVAATVVVEEFGGKRSIWLNGRQQGMASVDDATEAAPIKKVGHFPVLLHPDPKDVLMVGLGVGRSSGAVALHDVRRVDVVEIVPSLIETLDFFKEQTNDILHDPRYNFIVDDGRNYVASTDKTYDVIISDIYHPDVAGISALYAREYYEQILKKLRPDGLYAQWVTLYQMSTPEFKSIVATMADVFPHVTVWNPILNHPSNVVLVLGAKEDLSLSVEKIARVLENGRIAGDLFEGTDVLSLLSSYVMDEDALGAFIEGAEINTDDDPFIEYSAPKNRWIKNGPELSRNNLMELKRHITPVTDKLSPGDRVRFAGEIDRYFRARGHIYNAELFKADGDNRERLNEYLAAARLGVNDPYLVAGLKSAYLALAKEYSRRRDPATADWYGRSYELLRDTPRGDDVRVLRVFARLLAQHGDYAGARSVLGRAIELAPDAAYLKDDLKMLEGR